MKIYELFEAKPAKKIVIPPTKPRDPYARALAKKTGGGSHTKKNPPRTKNHSISDVSESYRDFLDI